MINLFIKKKNIILVLCFSHCVWWGLWSKKKRHRTSDCFEVSLLFQLTALTCREARKWPCPYCCFCNSVILHGVRPNIATRCQKQKWALAAIDLFFPSHWMTSNAASGKSHDIQSKSLTLCEWNQVCCRWRPLAAQYSQTAHMVTWCCWCC